MNPTIERSAFGRLADGREVPLFTLRDGYGMEVEVIGWGATIRAIRVPDAGGAVSDVVLGFDTLEEYLCREEQPISKNAPGSAM